MSSLQNKIYNHEVTPPASAWDKIVIDLDESQLENKFPLTLYNAQIDAPVETWDKIAGKLDNEQLENEFPIRLYKMELSPPVNTWKKIIAGLDSPNESSPVPVRKLSPFFRYAAAAIFIGALAYGIIKLTLNTTDKENNNVAASISKKSGVADKTKQQDTGTIQTPGTVAGVNKNDDATLEKSKTMVAKLDKPSNRVKRTLASSMVMNSVDEDVNDTGLSQSIYAYADHIPDIADRYVMLMTPDGNIIRMSKKWGSLLCCVSGEEQDADCKDQLKQWQEKMASSTLAPSPGNFMDIFGLVNSLD